MYIVSCFPITAILRDWEDFLTERPNDSSFTIFIANGGTVSSVINIYNFNATSEIIKIVLTLFALGDFFINEK